jgi:hypothetical protein
MHLHVDLLMANRFIKMTSLLRGTTAILDRFKNLQAKTSAAAAEMPPDINRPSYFTRATVHPQVFAFLDL